MPHRYQDIYPEDPLIDSGAIASLAAADLLTLEFFEAEPGEMPRERFEQHHILLNLKEAPMRVENWRDGEHRDFIYQPNEIVVTPAGVRSGWKWHEKSKVIVITLEPQKLERFAQAELGIGLSDRQLKSIPQFIDADIVQAGVLLLEAINSGLGSAVMFESYARIFLTKLIRKYGLEREVDVEGTTACASRRYQKVLEYVAAHFGETIALEDMAVQAGLSSYHFSRLFKKTMGQSPHQFVMAYRVEQAKAMLRDVNQPMIDIAIACGFADQAHFSRVFKKIEGATPRQWRKALSA